MKKCAYISIFFICFVRPSPFGASLFKTRPYNIFLVTFNMFKHAKVVKHIQYMRQKLKNTCSL